MKERAERRKREKQTNVKLLTMLNVKNKALVYQTGRYGTGIQSRFSSFQLIHENSTEEFTSRNTWIHCTTNGGPCQTKTQG